jgi:glycerophosphoryl diester phosphodiesterase
MRPTPKPFLFLLILLTYLNQSKITSSITPLTPLSSTHRDYYNLKVMAHRGVWGYFPEHSLRGFELAYFMSADYLETDINITKDNKLIIYHDSYLDDATNINDFPEFNDRRKSAKVDGILVKNKLFTSDFTFDEIKKFYLKQRKPIRPQLYNQDFKILLFEDLIEMVLRFNNLHGKTTGIYVEPKSPDYYQKEVGVNINQLVRDVLIKYGLIDKNSKNFKSCPIVIQSFEYDTLSYFKMNSNLPQIALMRWKDFYNLKELAEVSDGFGVDVDFVLYERIDDKLTVNGTIYKNTDEFISKVLPRPLEESLDILEARVMKSQVNEFVKYAEGLSRIVQVWNMNNDDLKFSHDPVKEVAKLAALGVSSFFSDFCDTAIFSVKHFKELLE